MPKNKYFSHDHNARYDRKMVALINEYKSSGLGIFWATCEFLHEENGKLEFDEITFAAIAMCLKEEASLIQEVIEKCIHKYKLFTLSENHICSNRVFKNLDSINTLTERAKKGAQAMHKHAQAQLKQNQAELKPAQADHKHANEIKLNETKEKKEKGVCFSEDRKSVIFKNGETQELGQRQLQLLDDMSLEAHWVFKGIIE